MIRSTTPSTHNEPSSSYLTSFCCCLFPRNSQVYPITTYEKNLKKFSELNIKTETTAKSVISRRSSPTDISSMEPNRPNKLVRRHSFSTYKNLTDPKPLCITSNTNNPKLSEEEMNDLIKKVDFNISKFKSIIIIWEYQEKALHRLAYPEKYSTDQKRLPANSRSFFHPKIQPCHFISTGQATLLITDTQAIRVSKQTELTLKWQENEETIAKRVAFHNKSLGLPDENIIRTGIKTFYGYNALLKKDFLIRGFSTTTEALLENCNQVKLSSKTELLSLIACLIHQVDGLHKADICHTDIKPHNICKTKTGQFKLIDRFGSIDFRKENLLDAKENLPVCFSPITANPEILNKLLQARNKHEAKSFAKQFDVFSCGSTIYQIISAFNNNTSIENLTTQKALPHERTGQPFTQRNGKKVYKMMPSCLKEESELNNTLRLLEENQKQVIRRSIDLDPTKNPSIEELKDAFPISLIKKNTPEE